MTFLRDASSWRRFARATAAPSPNPVAPVILSGPSVLDPIGETTADITWTVDRPVTGQIEYGLTAGYGSATTAETSFDYSQHTQTITGLSDDTLYHYHVIGEDQDGLTYDSGDQTFTTAAAITPPPLTGDYPDVSNPLVYEALISASQPAYLGVHVCSGHQGGTTQIARISNVSGLRNRYSSLSVENRDGSMAMLTRGGAYIIRTSDWTVLNSSASALALGWWSSSDPNLAFSLDGSRHLRACTVSSSGSVSTIATYNPVPPGGGSYSSVNFGGGQGVGDITDRWFSFFWTKSSGAYGVAVYDRQSQQVTMEKQVGTGSQRIDNCGMSINGDFVQYNIVDDGSGSGTGVDKGMWCAYRDGTGWFQMAQKQEHWDWARFANGQDAFCYWTGSGIHAVNPATRSNVNVGPSSTPGNTHLSGRAFDLPGWIWVSRAAVGGTAPGSNQAYARALDNSGDTMVYGWMHRTTSPGYESDTMGCINADGTRFH